MPPKNDTPSALQHCVRCLSASFLLLVTFGLALCGCSSPLPRVVNVHRGVPNGVATQSPRQAAGDYAPRIPDAETWSALAAAPGRQMISRTEVVKVIIDLNDDWRVYFLQSRRWEIHYHFASRFLSRPDRPVPEHAAFNELEYHSPNRHFVLGQISYFREQDLFTYELLAGDRLDVARTIRAFDTVRALVYFGPRLRYRPVPAQHETPAALAQFRAANVPVVTTNEIFGNIRFQPINPGEAYGYLRFIRGAPDPARVRPTDVVVIDNVPLDLPVCAGVITAELQTPLSHISVLSANRGTPNMALRGAMNDARLRGLEGRLVRLHVTPQDFSVEPAAQSDAERAWEARRPRNVFNPPLDLRDVGMPEVTSLRLSDVATVGAKAAQMGELAAINSLRVPLPRGFALPFRAYAQHLSRAGLDREITAMLADAQFNSDPAVREARLRVLRERIERAPVDPVLVRNLRARVAQLFPGVRVRFRSSTNAEDLPGFNGAGLYRSVVVPATMTDTEVADALRRVWASVWNFQGFEERTYYRINHALVSMAILVQESIDDDVVDGVAITANPFNEGRPGHFINVQPASREGGAVTSAQSGEVPEQIVYYTYNGEGEYERLSSSSLTSGAPVLREGEIVEIARVLSAIQRHFHGDDWQTGRAMDVEFILAGPARRLVVVQARPYTVTWSEDRGWARPPE